MFARAIQNTVLVEFTPLRSPEATHSWLLLRFRQTGAPFGTFDVTNKIKGNVGEAIAQFVGAAHDFAGWICQPANAHEPFSRISRSGLDLLWIRPGPSLAVALQEVKTSTDPDLGVASGLVDDYAKLFADDPNFTLHTRLQAAANLIEFGQGDLGLADALRDLAGASPADTHGVTLVPTLVHDGNPVASTKLIAVRTTLVGNQWPEVQPWSISLEDLDARIASLCGGQ